MDDLITILNSYHVDTLRVMIEHLEVVPSSNLKKDLVKALNEAILDNAANPEYAQSLSPVEQASLAQLITWGKPVPRTQLELRLVITRLIRSPLDGRRSPLPDGDRVLVSLLSKGLIVDQTLQPANKRRQALKTHDVVGVAADVMRKLRNHKLVMPQAISKEFPTVEAPAYIYSTSMESVYRQLFFVWSDLRNRPAKQLKSGTMAKRDLKRIAKAIGLDDEQATATVSKLDMLLRAMHLIDIDDGLLKAVDSPAAALFWSGSMRVKVMNLLTTYPLLDFDLSVSLREVRQYSYYSLDERPTKEIRHAMLDLINELSFADGWIPYVVLSRYALPPTHGSFAISDESVRALNYHVSWAASRYETRLNQLLQNLDRTIFIKALFELADLGILELGYAEKQESLAPPIAIKLSSWVRAYYQKNSPPVNPSQGQVIVQPDFQVLCIGPVSMSVLSSVECCAEREKIDDSVISYRITKERVYVAFQRGETTASIAEHLEEATGQPLPQNIKRSLREWEGQHNRIVLHRNITIIQADSKALIDVLLNDAITGPLVNTIDQHTVWVHNDHVNTVEKRLFALEQLPSFTEDAANDIANSMLWQDDCLHTRHPLPSLFVTATLRQFAEETESSKVWRLTKDSLAKVSHQGLTAPDILERISNMTGAAVPAAWVQRIKAWMGYFGRAQSTFVRLLRLEDASKIEELFRDDPQLSDWLHPLPEARALVSVDAENWDAVRARLAEWGILVEDRGWW